MLMKKERSMELYKKAGAEIQLLKALEHRLVMDMSKILSSADTDKLIKEFDRIDQLKSRAEDNMFRDHPDLCTDYIHVFYGNLEGDLDSSVNDEIKALAKGIADGLIR